MTQIFEVKNGRLTVKDDLYWDSEELFDKAVQELLDSPEKDLAIDLSQVSFIFSPFMGHIVRFCMSAREMKKNPSVLIGKQLEDIFKSSGLMTELPIKLISRNSA